MGRRLRPPRRRAQLVEDPVCYRDKRTRGVPEEVFSRVPREEIFARTGIQFLEFNTLYQLKAHTDAGLPAAAERLLLIPDLIHFFLSGRAVTEYTNATTTQMLDASDGNVGPPSAGASRPPRSPADRDRAGGHRPGPARPRRSPRRRDLPGVRVVAPATHDTGSAVVGAPLEEGWAYISSGTWSLAGVERTSPLVGADVARHNFSNEGGAFGTIRFLKNVMGLWILESCRQEWQRQGRDVTYESLLREVEALEASPTLIFPDDPRLLNPESMLEAIAAAAHGDRAARGHRAPRPSRRPSWTPWPSATPRSCGRPRPSRARRFEGCRSSGEGAATDTSTRRRRRRPACPCERVRPRPP